MDISCWWDDLSDEVSASRVSVAEGGTPLGEPRADGWIDLGLGLPLFPAAVTIEFHLGCSESRRSDSGELVSGRHSWDSDVTATLPADAITEIGGTASMLVESEDSFTDNS